MKPWTFSSAGTLIFGWDALQRLDEATARLRVKKAFVVTDANLVKAGVVEKVTTPLREAGVVVRVFDGCVPEPPDAVAVRATADARGFEPDVVVGLGGGSNMDTAKLVALLLAHGGTLADYVGDCRVPGPTVPVIAVPTTAGTGSEVSAAAVFTDTAKKMKVSTLSPFLRPAFAVVDPVMTLSCPPKVSADSGIDALTHAIEAFTAVAQTEFVTRPPGGLSVYQGKNPMADMMAEEAVRLVGKFLRVAVHDGADPDAREGMAMAATLAGLAFSNAGVALVHAMEYPVGGAVHVSHGAGNGLLLPFVMRYNMPGREAAFVQVAKLLQADKPPTQRVHPHEHTSLPEKVSVLAEAAVAEVERLRKDIGIPTRLRDIGVTEDMLPGFAAKAFSIKRLMRVNPRMPQSEADILDVYRAAF